MSKKYAILDLETEGKTTFGRFCNPLDPRHFIVIGAVKRQGEAAQLLYNDINYNKGMTADEFLDRFNLDDIHLLIGQNFKFDMLWFWHSKKWQDWLRPIVTGKQMNII